MCNGFYVDFINIDGGDKFVRNPSLHIEHKQTSDANQEP